MAILFSDDFTGTNGASWDATKWTQVRSGTNGVATIQGNAGQLYVNSTASATYYVRETAIMSDMTDQEVTGTFVLNTSGNGGRLYPFLSLAGTLTGKLHANVATGWSGAFIQISGSTAAQTLQWLVKTSAGTSQVPVGTTATFTFAVGTTYNYRLRRDGNTLYAKIWTGSEPGSWSFTADISAYTLPAGKSGFSRDTASTTGATADWRVDNYAIAETLVNLYWDADTPTASLAANDVVVGLPVTTDVSTISGHALASNDVTVETTTAYYASRSRYLQANGGTGFNGLLAIGGTGNVQSVSVLDFDFPIPAGKAITSGSLRITGRGTNVTTNYTLSLITAEWVDGALTWTLGPSKTISMNANDGFQNNIDVTDLLAGKNSFYGFHLSGGSSSQAFFSGMGDGTDYDAKLQVVVEDYVAAVDLTVDTPTTSLATPEPIVQTINPVNIEVINDTATISLDVQEADAGGGTQVVVSETPTLSAASNDVTVDSSVSPSATIDLDTPAVVQYAIDPTVRISTTVDADETGHIDAASVDPTVDIMNRAIVYVDTPRIDITHKQVAEVNGEPVTSSETEDPYFNSTWRTLRSVKKGVSGGLLSDRQDRQMTEDFAVWLRLNEKSGTTAADRADNVAPYEAYANYDNVVIGQLNGPAGRHSVYFNGDAAIWERMEDATYNPTSLEFTFKTDKADQFIMGGTGIHPTSYVSGYIYWDLWLVNGKLEYRWGTNTYDQLNQRMSYQQTVLTGFKTVSDGNWHHVVIQWAPQGYGTEMYVDAVLDIRRRLINAVPDFPDFIGGRFNDDNMAGREVIDKSDWFVGDMTEVVYRNGRTLNVDEIATQRDNVMGIIPVRPDPARLTFVAPDATAKGNKPRLLVLDFGRPINDVRVSINESTFGGKYTKTMPGGDYAGTDSFNYYNWTGGGADCLVFAYSVIQDWRTGGIGQYRDIVTDNPRLIDLTYDINMDDYDAISIINYPQSAEQWQVYDANDAEAVPPYLSMRVQLENLMTQIKQQVVAGKGLVITDPGSAVAIGLVNKIDYVPKYTEKVYLDNRIGIFTGIYDWYSAKTNPFRNSGTNPTDLAASRWLDTHANIRQRVRTLVPGLTDHELWFVKDMQVWQNIDPMASPPGSDYIRHEYRPKGYNIGDETFLEGSYIGFTLADWVMGGGPGWGTYDRRINGWLAAPSSAIRAGKALTTFGSKFWMERDEVDNPWKDHAVTIVVEPGDTWDGQTVLGKVFANFTEAGTAWASVDHASIQVDPDTSQNPLDKNYWTWTNDRGGWNGTNANGDSGSGGVAVQIANDGSITIAGGVSTKTPKRNTDALISWHWSSNVPEYGIEVPTITHLGVNWVLHDVDADGSATVGAETATVSVRAEETDVVARKATVVELATARTQTEAVEMRDVVNADASILVPTATAVLKGGNFVEYVFVDTATVTIKSNDVAGSTLSDAEVITLVLPAHTLTLYMEDN